MWARGRRTGGTKECGKVSGIAAGEQQKEGVQGTTQSHVDVVFVVVGGAWLCLRWQLYEKSHNKKFKTYPCVGHGKSGGVQGLKEIFSKRENTLVLTTPFMHFQSQKFGDCIDTTHVDSLAGQR